MNSMIKEQYAHFRDPSNPGGDPPEVPTSRLEVLHDTCFVGSLDIKKPSIKSRIHSGAVVARFLSEDGSFFAVQGSNGVSLADMLAVVETYCKPLEDSNFLFSPEEWTSEELLIQVYDKVREYHATFR